MLIRTLTALALVAAPASALAPPHDDDNSITCIDCHALIPGGVALELRNSKQENVCFACHNPTGQAAAMSDVAVHVVADGAFEVDCGACHDPHGAHSTLDEHAGGVEAPNLALVRSDTAKYYPAAVEPAVFQERPAHFARATAPYTGICQTCHVGTKFHTNTGASSDQTHEVGNDCTSCHAHVDGFMPSGCSACHATVQDNGDGTPVGGRPPVIGLFPGGGSHGHMAGPEVQDADCEVCHDVSTHMDGVIDLVDQDTGTLISFTSPVDATGDPDVSDFCLSCHDDDGAALATTPLDPFGSGSAPLEVASRFQGTLQWNEWYGDFCYGNEGTLRGVNSHHDISDDDQAFSGARLECTSCHNSHSAGPDTVLADPWDTSQVWTGTTSAFCVSCHGGGGGPTDPGMPPGVTPPRIAVDDNGMVCGNPYGDTCDINSTDITGLRPLESCDYIQNPWHTSYVYSNSPHGANSKRGWTGYSGAPGAELECTVCHDAHGSWSETNPLGNPYLIRDFVDGTAYVDDGVRDGGGWTGPPWDTTGVAQEVVVTVNGGTVGWGALCSTCHATWVDGMWAHSMCTGCQTCHGHGQDWDNADWGAGGQETSCQMCGNDQLDGLEECDDGNRVDGDGCSSECKLEP